MNDRLIEMAREAGAKFDPNFGMAYNIGTATFERFASLVQADMKAKYDKLLDEYARLANERIGTSDSDKGEYAIHQVRIFRERLADAIQQMPFGDTASSFATFVREFK